MKENKWNGNILFEDENIPVDEMKKAYETCPVPPEALNRVTAGIAKAKREQRIVKFFKSAGTAVAAACLGLVILTNSSANIANAMEKIPVIGAISNVVTFRNYSDKSGNFEADVDVPQVADGLEQKDNAANKTIQEYADKLIAMYEKDLRASEGEGNYTLKSSYEVVYEDEKLLSIRINSLVIMAGGNEFVKIFHIDKQTGNLVTLTDILKDGENGQKSISKYIKKQMKEQMKKDENVTYFIRSKEDPYGFDSISDETNFYFNKKGEIVVVFDEYEVAPGYMGVVEFTIPKNIAAVSAD